jgi:uncharacterized membrane protein YozB (DUF420 family)
MATTESVREPSFGARKIALLVVGAVAIYFVYRYTLHYFLWTEASYGYYWAYRLPLIAHVSGGLVALLVGVFQLWSGLNIQAMRSHPVSGRIYLAAVLVGSLAGMVLAVTSALFGFAWGVGVFSLAVAWLATTGMALVCIKRRNIKAHRQWMIRSYIVTFAFVLFRLTTDYIPAQALWGVSQADMSTAMIWAVWVLPLLAYDVYLQLVEVR